MPGGALSIFILADAIVHIFSHFYYLVMSYTPKKRSKTLLGLRLAQVAVLVFNALELVLFNNCGFPFAFAVWISTHAAILFVIFGRKCKKPTKRKVIIEKLSTKNFHIKTIKTFLFLRKKVNVNLTTSSQHMCPTTTTKEITI
jgi:Ni,Fe-hydrogenase I cytochrome b subunit